MHHPILQIVATAVSWFVLLYFMFMVAVIAYRLRILTQQQHPQLRLRASMAHIAMMVPSQATAVVYPPWEKMCEVISESMILEKSDAPHGLSWDSMKDSSPSPVEVFTYSNEGSLGAIYMWYCIAACVLNRNRDLSKPEPDEMPPARVTAMEGNYEA